MTRRRFFIPRDCILGETAVLPADQTHHLRKVLRFRQGDEVELFDGEGRSYLGRVESLGAQVHIRILQAILTDDPGLAPLVLAASLIKADRFEWVLQKGTELGVWRFLPLETHFTAVRIPEERLEARLERWQRIAVKKRCSGVIPVGMQTSLVDR